MKILHNWQNANTPVPARLGYKAILLGGLGGFLATLVFAGIGNLTQTALVLGSFGASCFLVFAYPTSPFSQPRNVIGGHFIATLTGLVVMQLFGIHWWSMGIGVGFATMLMLLFKVPHPPAASNPLIVMLGVSSWAFLLAPTLLGAIILVLVALFFNNLGEGRRYPNYW